MEITIHDDNFQDHISPVVNGERKSHGLIPRDYAAKPFGSFMFAKPFDIPLIPESEWQNRLDAQIAAKAQLSDVRNAGMDGRPIPSRDQNGKGYCWAHSSTSAAMIVRAINNEPYADLSAYAVACIIKNYQDQGGNGADSLEWIAKNGIPTSQFWPQQSMSRANDTPAMRANAALHKFTQWMDLDPSQMKAQLVTCLLLGFPVVSDFNWWGHSVCTIDLVSINPFTTRIWNSWSDSWSQNGTGLLQGNKAVPDNALGARAMTASMG
jgi:hypothetical protein